MAGESLSMFPSGFKALKLYSQIPIDGVGDFDVSRPSVATRINKLGLIETMLANVPLIDYTDGVCPVLLVQPQSTNLIERSETFDHASGYWTTTNSSVTSGFSAPDDTTNAYKLVEDVGVASTYFINSPNITVSTSTYTYTFYAKQGGRSWIRAAIHSDRVYFDLENTEIGTTSGATYVSSSITKLANGWNKCVITSSLTTSPITVQIVLADANNSISYNGDGTSGVYIFGAQVEEQPVATSYIKSDSGSSTTRLKDVITGAGDVNTFNSEEGVLFVEIAALANISGNRYITLSSGSGTNRIIIRYQNAGFLSTFVISSTSGDFFNQDFNVGTTTLFHKAAIRWSQDDVSYWVDGVKIGFTTSFDTFSPNTLNVLKFEDASGGIPFFGKAKSIQVLPYLTDEEMRNLTTQ